MIKPNLYVWIILLLGLSSCLNQTGKFKVYSLTLNHRSDTICISPGRLSFSWQVEDVPGISQTHYHLQVSSNPDFSGESIIYDSDKKQSSQSQNVKPDITLPHSSILHWRVKICDNTDAESSWSEPMQFYTAPDWKADWISTREHEVSLKRRRMGTFEQKEFKNSEDSIAVYMQKDFSVEKEVKRAHAYISGLGYYELQINGKLIGDQVLDPAFSDFQKTVYFNTLEVTEALQQGSNVIDITLGNGFYNLYTQNLFMLDQSEWKAPHKLLFQMHIEYTDGSSEIITSDKSWKWGTGPIVFNSIMGGETVDTQKEITIDKPVVLSEGPGGELTPQYIPSMKVNQRISPKSIQKLDSNTYVVDFGENITGSIALDIPETNSGRLIKAFYNEVVDSVGYLVKDYSKTHTKGRFQEDRIITNGQAFQFKNHFSYFGFRYAQIENYPGGLNESNIYARSIHTELQEESTFSSSNDRLNQLDVAISRTLKNSIHSMPGEEPTREKMGWTFDAGMNTMESYLYYFNSINAYEKYLDDLVDTQEPGGHIAPIVPTNGWGFVEEDGSPILYDDPWWGGTILYVMDELVNWTGDSSYYKDNYQALKDYTDFVYSTADENMIVHWSLGDWLDPRNFWYGWGPGLTSIETTSTLGLYYLADGTARIADQLGYSEDQTKYEEIAKDIKSAFFEHLYNSNEINDSLSQTGHALPLWLDAVPETMEDSVYQNLLDAIHEVDDHIFSGFIGIKPILDVLAWKGDKQLAFDMIMQEESPGWLHMVKNEYSTVGENLNAKGYGTGHHPFATNVGYWFYKYMLGFQASGGGWESMKIAPFLPTQLYHIEGEIQLPYGKASISIAREGDQVKYEISIPFNTEAEFIPYREVDEGIESYSTNESGNIILKAGKHSFTSTLNK